MPLFEYGCQDCGAVLEVFQQPSDPSPKLCGYRCQAEPGSEVRGQGQLARRFSAHGGSVRPTLRRKVTPTDAAASGLASYERTTTGLCKISGPDAHPDFIPTPEDS